MVEPGGLPSMGSHRVGHDWSDAAAAAAALPIRGKTNKQTKTQDKSHPIWSLRKPLDQPYEGRKQKEERIQPWSLRKGDLKHNKLKKKKKEKRQRNAAQMKEQTRSTEVQINEEEAGKLPEKEFWIMIVKMIKNLENKMEKIQESINKDLEELKNKYTEKNNYWN